ncbi:MAG: type III pantothenate kinase [Wenzhouxiangella sp.]
MSGPSDWLVDLGHSRIKWAQARDGLVIEGSAGSGRVDMLDAFEQHLQGQAGQRLWLSGQSNSEFVIAVTTMINRHGLSLQVVRTGAINLPVQPAYPALGSDRWLALQWPRMQSTRPVCVIDCGTAVTVDVVDENGKHLGGWILAGLGILRAGLLEKARGLPRLDSLADPDSEPGETSKPATSSAGAIARGTRLQLLGAVERAISAATEALGEPPEIWLTGGDAPPLVNEMANPCRHDPHLVLRGLALAAQST